MFVSTVFTSIYESIALLFNPTHKTIERTAKEESQDLIESLENELSIRQHFVEFMLSENDVLEKRLCENEEEINILNLGIDNRHEEVCKAMDFFKINHYLSGV